MERERSQGEEKALVDPAWLRTAVEWAGIGLWEFDFAQERGRWSSEAVNLLGAGRTVCNAQDWLDCVHPLDAERVAHAWARCVADDTPYEVEFRPAAFPGRWLLSRGSVHRDAAGAPIQAAGVLVDVSDRKRIEHEFAHARGRADFWAIAIERAAVPFATGTPDGRLDTFNPAFVALTGYTEAELRDLSWTEDLTPPEWREHEARHVARLLETGEPQVYEKEYVRKDRSRINVQVQLHVTPDRAGGPRYYAFLKDITEGKRFEAQLRHREEQLRLATDAAEIGFWDVDPVAGVLFWPPRVKAMFGISPERPVSMDEDFYPLLHPEDRERVAAAFARAMDPQERALYDVEYRTVGKEDGVLRWVAAKGRGIFDEGGRCVRVIGTAIDVTRRKQDEEALRLADRRKEEFIATLSHELRNPLSPVANGLEMLQRMHGGDPRTGGLLEIMSRQLRHLVRIVNDLLDVSRISRGMMELQLQPVRVQDFVREAAEQTGPALQQKKLELVLQGDAGERVVRGDRTRLTQLLGNLLSNAVKYSEPGGRIEVVMAERDSRAIVEVRDHGQGFDPEAAESLFEMFARGRDSTGLGIGLALARQLAQLHGGTLGGCSNGPGRGACFELALPLVPEGTTR